jgi:hypothetical protein
VLRHTRGRIAVGGVPVAALLERTAEQTARARGDVEGLTLAVAADRDRVAADLTRRRDRSCSRRSRVRRVLLVPLLLLVRRLTHPCSATRTAPASRRCSRTSTRHAGPSTRQVRGPAAVPIVRVVATTSARTSTIRTAPLVQRTLSTGRSARS